MTLPSTPRRAGPYNGNGSATSFSFTFKVFSDEDISVVRTSTVGVETSLTLDSDYSVTLNGDQEANPGGTVTYPISGTALATGEKLTIAGAIEYDQPTDIPDGGNFSPTALENALDRIEMQIQQLEERLDRAVSLAVSVSGVSPTLPVPLANTVLAWNPSGTSIANQALTTVARTDVALVDAYGAVGDGVTDDSAAFAAAAAASKTYVCTPNKTYVVGDHSVPVNGKLDLQGAIVKRKAGARNAVRCENYRSSLVNGEVQGDGAWFATTFSAGASAGGAVVALTSVTGLVVGMACFYPSAWAKGGIEANEILSIAGLNVTLKKNLRGNVSSGGKFLADFPIVKIGGGQYAGDVQNLFVRNFLLGMESGNNGSSGGNAFTGFGSIKFEDYVGAALKVSANVAAEDFSTILCNGGKTLASNYTGDGSTVRFAIPYNLAKKCYRWGTEPSIRLLVNGTRLPVADYTLDLATMEVVADVAPVNGATVQVQNYEYAAFNVLGQNIVKTQGSSIEGMNSVLGLAANIGAFFDGCELGFFSNFRMDTCGYAPLVLSGCDGMYFGSVYALYSPFGIIVEASCSNISFGGQIGTSLIPDADEFSVTSGKTEIIAEAFATRIHINFLGWMSKDGHTLSYADAIYSLESKTHFQPNGLAVGGVPSGLACFYGTGSRFVQVTEPADEIVFDGGTGDRYVQAKATNSTLRVGALGSGGRTELTCPNGVKLTLTATGAIVVVVPTSAAGLPTGALWNDGGTLKIA